MLVADLQLSKVEMIVSHFRRLNNKADLGYAIRVLAGLALTAGWLLTMYFTLLP